MRRPTLLTPILTVVAATLLAPSLRAQELVRDAHLDRLHDEAMASAYTSLPGGIEKAAWAHAAVAFQRGENDVRRVECLRTQAELFEALGYLDGARVYLEEAAHQAMENGDPFAAAMTYIDAALVAKEAGRTREAVDLGRQARDLVASPSLDITQRAAILDRLERPS